MARWPGGAHGAGGGPPGMIESVLAAPGDVLLGLGFVAAMIAAALRFVAREPR